MVFMSPKTKPGVSWLRVGYLAIAAIAIYILVSQLGSFRGSLNQLKTSNAHDDLLVLVGSLATFLFAALTYYFIALKPLKYLRTVFVEFGINTLNRLLPAGIGGIGANYVYLKRSGHTKAQAEAVVAANTVIGVIANLLLLAVLLFYFPARHFKYTSLSSHLLLVGCLIILLVAIIFSLLPGLRKKIIHNLRITARNVYHYRVLKLRLVYGLLCQVALTLAYVLALYFSLRAVHGQLPIGSLMLAYSFAIWLGAVIPAPGGAGTVDAGLVAGLVAFRVELPQAVAAVLIFRLVSFWLPLVLGVGPLFWAYRRRYL
jgi:glycosyltransferase 2 family protein